MTTPAFTLTVEELRSLVREAVRSELGRGPQAVEVSEVMTRAEVAELLDVDEHTITKWVRTKGLPGVSIGRSWRFRRSEVLAWMEEKR